MTPKADPADDGSKVVAGTPVGRRLVLGMVGLGALGVAFGSTLQSGLDSALAPLRRVDPSGLTSLIPGSGGWRYYSVTAHKPRISVEEYQLSVSGLVDHPATFSYSDLADLPQTNWTRDFQCVTGWRVQDVQWQGVRLIDLLDVVGIAPTATAVTLRSFDGAYTESLTMDQVMNEECMVATHLDGATVTEEHGGPARLLVTAMYGYKSLKWLSDIELVTAVEPGYWEVRGYDVDAYVGQSNGRSDEPI
ncbi:MAG: molybdopterin-dependent oxidoreductase [Candidatus Nanopelagicales bacterium]